MNKHTVIRLAIALTVGGLFCDLATAADSAGMLYGARLTNGQVVVRSLDLNNSRSDEKRVTLPNTGTGRLTGIFQRKDGSINLLLTATGRQSTRRSSVRVIGVRGQLMNVSAAEIGGLAYSYAIASVLVPDAGAPLALISHHSDTPRYWLANVDLQSGTVSLLDTIALDPHARYAHLTQCPDGRIYAVAARREADMQLVQIDLEKAAIVLVGHIEASGRPLLSDIRDLACAPSGQLYALADPTYSGTNSLFAMDRSTAQMRPLITFDVDRMAFVR